LMAPNYVWFQKLDYGNISFRCRECYETPHVIKNCPKNPQNKEKKPQRPKWWEGAQGYHHMIFKEEDLERKKEREDMKEAH